MPKKRLVITKGTRLNDNEMNQYALSAKASRSQVSREAGGELPRDGAIFLMMVATFVALGVWYGYVDAQNNKAQ